MDKQYNHFYDSKTPSIGEQVLYESAYESTRTVEASQELQQKVMGRTYLYMAYTMLLSAIFACIGYSSGIYEQYLNEGGMILVIVLEIVCMFGCFIAAKKKNPVFSIIMLTIFAAIDGITLSYVFYFFDMVSILGCFFVAAAMFLGLVVYGLVTKRNLSTLGTICYMGLIGVILMSIVSMFLSATIMDTGISFIFLALFIGITAYDAQQIKNQAKTVDETTINSIAVLGAIDLYLDFINIFINLLELIGDE